MTGLSSVYLERGRAQKRQHAKNHRPWLSDGASGEIGRICAIEIELQHEEASPLLQANQCLTKAKRSAQRFNSTSKDTTNRLRNLT